MNSMKKYCQVEMFHRHYLRKMLRNVVYINAVTRCARMANIATKVDYYCLHNHHQCQTLIVSLNKQTSSH